MKALGLRQSFKKTYHDGHLHTALDPGTFENGIEPIFQPKNPSKDFITLQPLPTLLSNLKCIRTTTPRSPWQKMCTSSPTHFLCEIKFPLFDIDGNDCRTTTCAG